MRRSCNCFCHHRVLPNGQRSMPRRDSVYPILKRHTSVSHLVNIVIHLVLLVLSCGVFFQAALGSALASERKYFSIAFQRALPNVAFAISFVVLLNATRNRWNGAKIFSVYSWCFLLFKNSPFIVIVFTACAVLVAVFFRSYWVITLVPTLVLYFG